MYNDGYPILTWEEERAQPTVQERFDKIAALEGEKISGKASSATAIIKFTKPSITAKVKKSNVNIKASKRACTGYQIQICKNKKFNSGVKKYTVKSTTLNKNIKLSSLKKGKNYIRARTYKTYNGKTVYGNWSKIKSVKR